MQEDEKTSDQLFDVRHFSKNMKQALNTASKIVHQSIAHHFWWACSTREGDEQIWREK